MRSWFEYEVQLPGSTEWLRRSFNKRQDLGYPADPTERDVAFEMLQVIAPRWKPGTKLRLVKITEEWDSEMAVGQV